MKAKNIIVSACIPLLIAATLTSCVKSFIPDVKKYDELLVVDGMINDGPGPYTIKLSKSYQVKEFSTPKAYSGCTVYMEDNLGTKVKLTEKTTGEYQTNPSEIQGVPGRSYKLIIGTSEGEWYESDPELLLPGTKIQDVWGEVMRKTEGNKIRDGYQFFLNSSTLPTADNYLLWRVERTYKFKVDYQAVCYYDNGVHYILDKDSLRTCYNVSYIPELFLLNTNELQQTEAKRIPLHFEDNYTKALTIRYSIKVEQLTIDKKAFTYWSTLKKIVDAGGELYTQQPFQVANNLKNITNPDKPVLGYFTAAGHSEKRIFITPVPLVFHMGMCIIPSPQYYPLSWFKNAPDLWPVFYTGTYAYPLYVDPECVDCREDGVLEKPSYWID